MSNKKPTNQSENKERIEKVIQNITQNLNDLADILLSHTADVPQDQKRKRRDPNAPKQPPSNFFLFSNAIREEVDKENPNATFTEKSKIYGARWQQLTEEEKKPYTEKAKKERERYNKELTAYENKTNTEPAQPSEKKIKTEVVQKEIKKSKKKAKVVPTVTNQSDNESSDSSSTDSSSSSSSSSSSGTDSDSDSD